jgi:integrase/recombinase XerD
MQFAVKKNYLCYANCYANLKIMATSIKYIIDDRRPKDDGTFPIVLRITHNRITRYSSTGYYALPSELDSKSKSITSKRINKDELKIINSNLLQKFSDADKLILELEKYGDLAKLSATELKSKIENKSPKVFFSDYAGKLVVEFKKAHKLGNASVYQQAIDFVDRHANHKKLTFDEINFNMLKHFETQHFSNTKVKSLNGLSFYLRTIRAIFNRAIDEKIIKRDIYPFDTYSIKDSKTLKRAIPKTDIDKIRDAQFEPDSNIWNAHNYFMFSFYNIGMNFADIAFLKMNNLIDGRISYTRAKTGKHYSIKISEPTKAILQLYTSGKKPDDFIFPIIKRKTPELQMLDLMNERKTYNKWLKKIGKSVGIESNLTSYVARHSWATIAKDLNVPISVISEGLGHEDIKTTQIYLDSFDDDVIDKANELIIS